MPARSDWLVLLEQEIVPRGADGLTNRDAETRRYSASQSQLHADSITFVRSSSDPTSCSDTKTIWRIMLAPINKAPVTASQWYDGQVGDNSQSAAGIYRGQRPVRGTGVPDQNGLASGDERHHHRK